jgi:hypothetical protein
VHLHSGLYNAVHTITPSLPAHLAAELAALPQPSAPAQLGSAHSKNNYVYQHRNPYDDLF